MVSFSFAEETPAAGTYDRSNLVDYGVYVDAIAYTASFDTKYPSKATGSISVHLTGGTGAKLTGTLDGVAPPGPLAGGGGAGEVKVHLEFPP